MTSGTKRLGRVAREFNVGISTMVEFLTKKGFEITSNPNAKIEPSTYDLLQKEYSRDIDLKKESEKLNLRANRHQKNEHHSIDDHQDQPEPEAEEAEEEVLRITDKSAPKSSVKPTPNAPELMRTNTPKAQVKVMGKIDLDAKTATHKEKAVEKEVPDEKKVKAEKPAAQVQAPKEEVLIPEKAKEAPQPAEKPAELKKAKQAEPNQDKQEKPAQAPIKKAKPETAEPVEKEQSKLETPKVETPAKKVDDPNELKTNVPKVENDLKVIGMIDLTSINQRTRPPKKSKKQRDDERKARQHPNKPAADQSKDTSSNGSEISHKPQKMNGPTVVGKIDLPKKAAGDDKDQSANAQRKRKRKRIRKERVDPNKPATTQGQAQAQGQGQAQGAPRPQGQNALGRGGNQNNRPAGANQGQRKQVHKRPVRPVVLEVDVQKQVKDTLARLTNKSKSKTSKYRREKRADIRDKAAIEEAKRTQAEKNIIQVTEFVSVAELASMMDLQATQVIGSCMSLGLFVSINQRLDAETMALVAEEFGFKVEFISAEVMEAIEVEEDTEDMLISRPPIVTVMGHVDHGKTSLLDYIRETNVIAGEAGGITQHIGAYNVALKDGRKITFLDTPGHEAFTAMRARGAQATDIAIIIVAADDSVMPQTIEAINHASAAGVPIVFAINKIDKPGANPEKIKEKLAAMNYLVEEWGGKYQSHDISAKTGVGIEELLEKVLLEAEMLELKANPNKRALGTVIESSLDKGRGYVSTILNVAGTLREGDIIIAGPYFGHVKAMFNERNQRIKEAGPAEPALVLGLNGAPQAGDKFNVMETEREARSIANKREQLQREQGMRTQKHITLDEIGRRIAIGNFQELNVIVKGDVDGSIEALSDSLIKLSTEEIQVNVKHKAVGQISESDVMLASASDAIIIGFQVRPSLSARKLAEQEQIDIRLYSIIYDAIEELKAAMEGMLSPEIKEEILGTAEVQDVFKITKVGTIAGSIVRDGKITRQSRIRVIRDGIVVYTGTLASLKRFKDDAKEVLKGYECGIGVDKYNDIKAGDFIEAFHEVEVAKKL